MTEFNTLAFYAAKGQYEDQEVIEVKEFLGATDNKGNRAENHRTEIRRVRMPKNIYLGYEGNAYVSINNVTGRASLVTIPIGGMDRAV